MNNEIKEIKRILNSIQYSVDENDWFEMEGHNLKPLLDYITNLQERCEYLERSNNRREDEIMSLRDECVDGETHKLKNEKAIEYINDWLDGKNNDDIILVMNRLGNILQDKKGE